MKKLILIALLALIFTSCEYEYNNCYTFEVEKKTSYVPDVFGLPYRPTTYEYSDYTKCGLTRSVAEREAKNNEYSYQYYYGGYYITEVQTCNYWLGY